MSTNTDIQTIESNTRKTVIDQIAKLVETKHLVLPPDYSYANAIFSAMYKLTEADRDGKTLLEKCTTPSIQKALRKMVIEGLSTEKDQVSFIAYGNKLVCQRGYAGNKAIAKRVGMRHIVPTCVYENDVFDYEIVDGMPVIIQHKQKVENIDESKIIGAYAVATMEDGFKIIDIMTMAQIKKAWAQGIGKNVPTAVQTNFTTQMAKKTVVSRLCKQIINESDDATLYDDDTVIDAVVMSKPQAPDDNAMDIAHTEVVTTTIAEVIPEPIPEPIQAAEATVTPTTKRQNSKLFND